MKYLLKSINKFYSNLIVITDSLANDQDLRLNNFTTTTYVWWQFFAIEVLRSLVPISSVDKPLRNCWFPFISSWIFTNQCEMLLKMFIFFLTALVPPWLPLGLFWVENCRQCSVWCDCFWRLLHWFCLKALLTVLWASQHEEDGFGK
jgi:hypothetical protein